MNNDQFYLLKINLRVFVMILVLLFAFDISLGLFIKNLFAQPQEYRVEDQSIHSLKNLVDQINKDEGYKIVFLGDSATYGSAVTEASQTIPAYTGQLLSEKYPGQKIKVYNLAMKGYGVSEAFFVLNAIKDAKIDLLIYNVSLGWINREQLLDHQSVLDLTNDYYQTETLRKLGVTMPKPDNIIETRLQDLIEDNWKLYKHRYLINYYLFGKPLSTQLKDVRLAILEPSKLEKQQAEETELYRPWKGKDWATKYANSKGWKFGSVNFSDENKQLEFYELMLELLDKKSIPAVFYATPQNLELMESYNRLDRAKTFKSIQLLQEFTNKTNHKVTFLNYVDQVNYENFSDSIHLIDQGNKELALILTQDLDKLKLIGE